jgi:hypothetical protein
MAKFRLIVHFEYMNGLIFIFILIARNFSPNPNIKEECYISSPCPPKIDVALKITIEFMINHCWILIQW